jgi:thiamine-monophosphate kinase
LHEAAPIHALIDISDGLSSDLAHILAESGRLGAELDAEAIPIHPDAHAMSRRDGLSALEHALHDGEDFELCLVVSPDDACRLLAAPGGLATLHRIGQVTSAPGLRLRTRAGTVDPIESRGFDHFREAR